MPSFKNHLAVNASYDVAEACRPLKNLNVSFFCYHRIYSDDSEVMVSSDSSWTEYFYGQNCSTHADTQYVFEKKFDRLLWPCSDSSPALIKLRELTDIFHGMSFFLEDGRKDGYTEVFGFGLSRGFDLNSLINQAEFLKKFCFYFSHKISTVVRLSRLNKIIPINPTPYIIESCASDLNAMLGDRFLSEIQLDEYREQQLGLTVRELHCVDHLLLGKTGPEIAKALSLSPRTVETHLLNLKNKLSCNSKSELINRLIKLGFMPSSKY